MSDLLILPTEIPWRDLKGKELEELLYWLFDAMGARDLEWRIGGTSSGTSDQGRDLELSFYVASPDGDLVKQKWWVEAKGRSATVEPFEVKSAVINAAGKVDVDVIVIATNSVFSNPTRDWIKEWQKDHVRPKVKLWERTDLENLCSKNPIAVVRLFGRALSPKGKLEVAKTKLWDYASFTDEPTLIKLWKARKELVIDSRSLMALASSEAANGDIDARSWAMLVDEETIIESLGSGLLNFFYLVFRANESGVRQEPLIKALAYLVLVCIKRIGSDETAGLLLDVWDSVEGREYPEQIRKIILHPVLDLLRNEIRDVCTSDCGRITTDRIILDEDEVERYWRRLNLGGETIGDEQVEKDSRVLVIESHKERCKVGLHLDEKISCPLCNDKNPEENIPEALRIFKIVSDFRAKKAIE